MSRLVRRLQKSCNSSQAKKSLLRRLGRPLNARRRLAHINSKRCGTNQKFLELKPLENDILASGHSIINA